MKITNEKIKQNENENKEKQKLDTTELNELKNHLLSKALEEIKSNNEKNSPNSPYRVPEANLKLETTTNLSNNNTIKTSTEVFPTKSEAEQKIDEKIKREEAVKENIRISADKYSKLLKEQRKNQTEQEIIIHSVIETDKQNKIKFHSPQERIKKQTENKNYREWSTKYDTIVDEVFEEFNIHEVFKSKKRKEKFNKFLNAIHFPKQLFKKHLRLSTSKEIKTIGNVYKEIFLRLNQLDDKNIEKLEEALKNRCVEGIRKQSLIWGSKMVNPL